MMENKIEKKKLLVTATTFPRWKGDSEPRFVLDLASNMTDEFDVTVLVPMAIGAKEKEMMDGVKVIRYHYFPIHRWETLCYPGAIVPRIKEKKVRLLLVPFLIIALYFNLLRRLNEFDFVLAHWFIPQGIIQSLFHKPYIVTGHGGDVTSLNKGILKSLKYYCLKRATCITVVSEHLKKEALKIYKQGNVHVISMGCNVESFGREHYVENYFKQGDKKVILFVGRLAEKKGVTYLIEAMRSVNALLIIVGDGPLKESLEEQARKIKDKVQFIGAKNHYDLKKIYASADIFVIPSITAEDGDQEGFGLVILEAMASGVPVVASNTGGVTDIIEDELNGLLCEEKNISQLIEKINRLLYDKELYEKLRNNATKKLERFDYNSIAREYKIQILNCLMERGI